MNFTDLVTGVGFQIACIMAMAAWINKKDSQAREDNQKTIDLIREDAKADKELLMAELSYNREVNSSLLETSRVLANSIKQEVEEVRNDVREIKDILKPE